MTPEVSWMLADLNSYFASCEQQVEPRLRGRPIAVVPMLDVPTTAILAASYEAKRFGVRTGTLVGESMRMCPGIQFVQARHSLYIEMHEKILDAVERVLPIENVLSIDEMSFRLTGSQTRVARARELALEMKRSIELRVGSEMKSSIGIAQNQLLAKVASDLEKPNGLVILSDENRERILSPLSVRVLPGVGPKTEARLNGFGVRTIADLLKRDVGGAHTVFGSVLGDRYYEWIRGKDLELADTQTKTMSHQHVLSPIYRNHEGAISITLKLLERLAARLRKEGYYAGKLAFSVKWSGEGAGSWERYEKFDATQDTLFLRERLRLILTELPRGERPLRVGVTVSDLQKNEYRQISLFADVKRERLFDSVDRVNSKFGKNAVTFASSLSTEGADHAKIAFHRIPGKDEV